VKTRVRGKTGFKETGESTGRNNPLQTSRVGGTEKKGQAESKGNRLARSPVVMDPIFNRRRREKLVGGGYTLNTTENGKD